SLVPSVSVHCLFPLSVLFLRLLPPASSTLFPYTTLFRSRVLVGTGLDRRAPRKGIFLAWSPATPRAYGTSLQGGDHEQIRTGGRDRKSTRLNSSHVKISYAVFCLKKKNKKKTASTERHIN